MKLKINYKSRYKKEKILEVLELLKQNLQIKEIVKITGVPETTIRNWKFSYSNLYGNNKKLNDNLKHKVIELLNKGESITEIAKKLKVNYNEVRLFLKKELSEKEYSLIRSINRGLPEDSKVLTPELAYILGVMYGDGHFEIHQIRLGTKDKDFMDYFVYVTEKWCNKKNFSS